MASHRQRGFTIVELLVVMAVMGVVLAAIGALFVSNTRAYSATEAISNRQQEVQLAINLFRYEVGLAGYRGTCGSFGPNAFSGNPTFEVIRGEPSDSLRVRYFEDRWPATGCGSLRTMTFSVNHDENVLYTAQDGAEPQPAMQGIKQLEIVEYIDSNGGRTTSMPSAGFIAVSIKITYDDDYDSYTQFVVGLKNPQVNPTES